MRQAACRVRLAGARGRLARWQLGRRGRLARDCGSGAAGRRCGWRPPPLALRCRRLGAPQRGQALGGLVDDVVALAEGEADEVAARRPGRRRRPELGTATTPQRSGSDRQKSTPSSSPSGGCRRWRSRCPADGAPSKPAAASPAHKQVARACRSSRSSAKYVVGQGQADGHRGLERAGVHEGQELLGRAAPRRRARPGRVTQPTFQPVQEKVLPADEMREGALGHAGQARPAGVRCAPSKTRCS